MTGEIGPSKKLSRRPVEIVFDPETLPEMLKDVVPAATRRGHLMGAKGRENIRKAVRERERRRTKHRRAKAALRREIAPLPKVRGNKNTGRLAKILAAAKEWTTLWEIREATGFPHSSASQGVNKLWHRGEIDKRLNPNAALAPERYAVRGPASCLYQYRAAQKETAP